MRQAQRSPQTGQDRPYEGQQLSHGERKSLLPIITGLPRSAMANREEETWHWAAASLGRYLVLRRASRRVVDSERKRTKQQQQWPAAFVVSRTGCQKRGPVVNRQWSAVQPTVHKVRAGDGPGLRERKREGSTGHPCGLHLTGRLRDSTASQQYGTPPRGLPGRPGRRTSTSTPRHSPATRQSVTVRCQPGGPTAGVSKCAVRGTFHSHA